MPVNGYDLHHNVKAVPCLAPVVIGTTGTGKTSKIIDRLGYNGVDYFSPEGRYLASADADRPELAEAKETDDRARDEIRAAIDALKNRKRRRWS